VRTVITVTRTNDKGEAKKQRVILPENYGFGRENHTGFGVNPVRVKSREPVFKPKIRLFASVLCHAWEETDWNPDFNVKAGINIRSPYAEKRAIQIFGEYYHGNLPFGQFYKLRAEYYGAGINVSF